MSDDDANREDDRPEPTAGAATPDTATPDTTTPDTAAPPASATEDADRTVPPPALLTWLVPTCTAAVVVAFAASRVPPRARLLGLFPVAVGMLIGSLGGHLSKTFFPRGRWWVVAVGCVLGGAAFAGGTWLAHRTWAEEARAALEAKVRDQRKEADPNGMASPAMLEVEQRALDEATSFSTHLVRRLTQLGTWSRPAAFAFWGAEILLAAGAAGVLTWMGTAPNPRRDSDGASRQHTG